MSIEESRNLRKILYSIAINKKCERIHQKIQQRIDEVTKDWNETISNYVRTIANLFELIQLAEQQQRLDRINNELKSFNELTKATVELCDKFFGFIKLVIPDSSINVADYMEVLTKADGQLEDIKEMLSSILIVSSSRDVIENVQEVKLKMEEIQSQMQVIQKRLTDCMEKVLKHASNSLGSSEEASESTADDVNSFEE